MIAEWFAKNLPQAELTFDIIDLELILTYPLSLDESEMPQTGTYIIETKRWRGKIATYAGFIFIVPQYNWGYPAVFEKYLTISQLRMAGGKLPACLVTFGTHQFQGLSQWIALLLVSTGTQKCL